MSDTRKAARTRRKSVRDGGDPGVLRAVGYCRVSTEQQESDGLSLGVQRELVSSAVGSRGWVLSGVREEQGSARSVRLRPGLRRVVRELEAGVFDVLVVARLDRLSRSPLDFYVLMDRAKREGWAILCLSPELDMTTTMGRAAAGMAMVFAEFERGLMGDRQRESIAARKRAGTYKAPPVLMSREVEERIAHLAGEGFGARRIARQLELEGFRPPRASSWQPSTVQVALRRLRASDASSGPFTG